MDLTNLIRSHYLAALDGRTETSRRLYNNMLYVQSLSVFAATFPHA